MSFLLDTTLNSIQSYAQIFDFCGHESLCPGGYTRGFFGKRQLGEESQHGANPDLHKRLVGEVGAGISAQEMEGDYGAARVSSYSSDARSYVDSRTGGQTRPTHWYRDARSLDFEEVPNVQVELGDGIVGDDE